MFHAMRRLLIWTGAARLVIPRCHPRAIDLYLRAVREQQWQLQRLELQVIRVQAREFLRLWFNFLTLTLAIHVGAVLSLHPLDWKAYALLVLVAHVPSTREGIIDAWIPLK